MDCEIVRVHEIFMFLLISFFKLIGSFTFSLYYLIRWFPTLYEPAFIVLPPSPRMQSHFETEFLSDCQCSGTATRAMQRIKGLGTENLVLPAKSVLPLNFRSIMRRCAIRIALTRRPSCQLLDKMNVTRLWMRRTVRKHSKMKFQYNPSRFCFVKKIGKQWFQKYFLE